MPLFMHPRGYQSLASANVIAAVAKIALNSALRQTVINIFALFYNGQKGGGVCSAVCACSAHQFLSSEHELLQIC